MADYSQKEKSSSDAAVKLDKVKVFATAMSMQACSSYAASGNTIWHATLGPGDCIYILPCIFIAELNYTTQDIVGFRLSVILVDESAKKSYELLVNEADVTGQAAKLALDVILAAAGGDDKQDKQEAGGQEGPEGQTRTRRD